MKGLPAAIVLTVIISYFFFFQKKKLSFLQNSIVFMILTLNLYKFETTKNPFLFIVVPFNCLDYLLIYFKILKYTHWNFLGETIVNLAYLLIGLGIARIVNVAQKRSNAKA